MFWAGKYLVGQILQLLLTLAKWDDITPQRNTNRLKPILETRQLAIIVLENQVCGIIQERNDPIGSLRATTSRNN